MIRTRPAWPSFGGTQNLPALVGVQGSMDMMLTGAKLAATKESEALIGIFDGMNQMKKHSSGAEPIKVKKVAVMGAGLMEAGIAQVSAEKGYEVLLKDRDDVSLGRGITLMNDNWEKKYSRERMTKYQYNLNTLRVTPLSDQTESWKRHFESADLVIEAVFESLELKRKIIQQVESVKPDHCVFATNTSAIPIADIAAPGDEVKRPENIVGMHYLSPRRALPVGDSELHREERRALRARRRLGPETRRGRRRIPPLLRREHDLGGAGRQRPGIGRRRRRS